MSLALISSEYCSDEDSEVDCDINSLPNNVNQSTLNEDANKTDDEVRLADSENLIEKQSVENRQQPQQIDSLSVTPTTNLSDNCEFKCPYCPDAYNSLDSLLKHIMSHAGIIWETLKHLPDKKSSAKNGRTFFVCDICGKSCRSDSLIAHVMTHTDKKPFECFICRKRYRSLYKVKEHLYRQHHKMVPITSYNQLLAKYNKSRMSTVITRPCYVVLSRCDGLTKTQNQPWKEYVLRKYLAKKHKDSDLPNVERRKSHICTLCNKQFSFKSYLHRHFAIHKEDDRFKCQTCGECFSRKNVFSNHLKIHLSRKRFKCDYCTTSFARKRDMLRHMKKHTMDWRHYCKICSKSFYRKDAYDKHVRRLHST